ITGSSGKTSTKEMIRAVLATRYRTHATSGNLNNLVGVPLTILAAPDDAEALVAEAGASVPGEIARLRDVIEPTIAAITNVGYAHVEGFGSLGGVLREKVALVDGAGVAGVGTDPPELAREARRRTRTAVERGGLTIPDDTYNANPASLAWALKFAHWLAGRRRRPLAVVVGSMLELGDASDRLHAAAAREIAALEPALIGAVGAFVPAFEPLSGALGARLVTASDAAALGPKLAAALRGDEIVLLKASRGVALERVLPFLTQRPRA